MAEIDLVEAILLMYRDDEDAPYDADIEGWGDKHPLVMKTSLDSPDDARRVVDELKYLDFLKEIPPEEAPHEVETDAEMILWVTKQGFEFAHERTIIERQERTNKLLAYFTVILAITALVQAVGTVLTKPRQHLILMTASGTAAVLAGVVIAAYVMLRHSPVARRGLSDFNRQSD